MSSTFSGLTDLQRQCPCCRALNGEHHSWCYAPSTDPRPSSESALKWSSEFPSVAGWYWVLGPYEGSGPEIVRFRPLSEMQSGGSYLGWGEPDELVLWRKMEVINGRVFDSFYQQVDIANWRFCGPLVPPSE